MDKGGKTRELKDLQQYDINTKRTKCNQEI